MYDCFHCGSKSVAWRADYDFEDFGLPGKGIVQMLECTNCGAEIEYRIKIKEDESCQSVSY